MSVANPSQAALAIAAADAKKTRLVRVSQEYIDWLLTTPYKPFRGMPQHLLDQDSYVDKGESLRDLMARIAARRHKERERDLAILEQHKLYGFAEIEVEIDDDMEEKPVVGN
ncbi:unnamed protein product [Urochloa humidicola]